MVGVPRSKGCATCRKRSVKCDEGRPSCSQCRRGGRLCPGYVRDRKFVDEGYRFQQRRGHGSGVLTLCSPNNPSCEHQHRIQIVAAFVQDLFPTTQGHPQHSFIGGWLWLIPSVLQQSQALDHAAEAIALGYYGRQSKLHEILRKSYAVYEAALQSLSRALRHSKERFRSETLCTALLMLHYERFLRPEERSWLSHAGGIRNLIQQRGPEMYRTGIDHAMLMASRGYIITESLLAGEACFLDEQQWKDVRFAAVDSPLAPTHHSLYNDGLDYFTRIPRLLHQVKSSKGCFTSRNARAYERAMNLRAAMMLWYQALQIEINTTAPILTVGSTGNYSYVDSISASFVVNYCAYMILVNQTLDIFHQPRIYVAENCLLAKEIARSTAYCSQTGFCGTGAMGMALPIALTAAADEDKAWISACIHTINDPEKSLKSTTGSNHKQS